jgi:rhamnosyltransferase
VPTFQLPLTLSVVIPTKNGGAMFKQLATHLRWQRERFGFDVLVVDSGSTDETVACAIAHGFRVHEIPADQYGHGKTRNLAMRLVTSDIVCLLTQDVLPCTPDWPEVFVSHFVRDASVAGVLGRQVPRSADTAEMHFVSVNYPATPHRYDPVPGGHAPSFRRVVFSHAFAAVRREVALSRPYIDDIPVSEDQVWAKMVTASSWAIVYEPRAEALHGHRYTLGGLFRRSFLIGRAGAPFGLLDNLSFAVGMQVLRNEMTFFVRHGHAHWLPWVICYEFVRWLGFQCGKWSLWRSRTPVIPSSGPAPVNPAGAG